LSSDNEAESINPSAPLTQDRFERLRKPATAVETDQMPPSMTSERGGCSNCGNPSEKCSCEDSRMSRPSNFTARPFVYALGRIDARFPRLAVEKEFAQVTGRADAVGLTDREVLHSILSQRQNRYLARQMCWVFTIEGLDTYIVLPRDPIDYDLLLESLRPTPRPTDIAVIIGIRGSVAPPDMCKGLEVPIVYIDQLYSFDVDTLIKSIPKPEKIEANKFKHAAEELLWRVMQITDNAGARNEHRAVNYLAVRYHEIYARTAEAFAANSSLTSVEIRPSRLSGTREVKDVIFSYTNRQTDVIEKYFVRVDVTEEFPFLVTKMSPYYDR
jgi:hypothetical protein